jgi:hypothetical protein
MYANLTKYIEMENLRPNHKFEADKKSNHP